MRCDNAATGGPEEIERGLLEFELSRYLRPWLDINPKLTYDLENRVAAVRLLLFLFRPAEGPLHGGLDLGWDDDSNDLQIKLFVGPSFDLVGKT
ncbi:MAG: hypothetical protein AAGC60_16745 [Acidobacteriota bacterium]